MVALPITLPKKELLSFFVVFSTSSFSVSNNMFHEFSKEVQEEIGLPLGEKVFPLWQEWLKEIIRAKRF
jgi:hypothetical protein